MDFIHTLLSFAQNTLSLFGTIVAVFLTFFSSSPISETPPFSPYTETTNGSSTTTVTKIAMQTSTTTTAIKKSATTTPSSPPITKTATTPPPPKQINIDQQPTITPEDLNTQTRAAIVNILCTTAVGGLFRPISGSGIFIDTRGVILTNAHVAQFFLLKDYPTPNNVTCTIRSGSPARPLYYARLLYLPPQWVTDNASQLVAEQAKGTGENDFAFLLVTESVNPSSLPLPTSFPALAMNKSDPFVPENVLLAGYPAGFLDGITIENNLHVTSAYSLIQKLYTFTEDISHIDLVSVGGTVVAQGGSSGGAVVRSYDGKLIGVISTDTVAATTAERDLRAITISHIDRSLFTAHEGGIQTLLMQNLQTKADIFASTTAPLERAALVKVIELK